MTEKLWKSFGSIKVSNYGDFWSIKYDRPVGYMNEDGYWKVGVSESGKRKTYSGHILVFKLFSEEELDPSLEINHLDGDKLNNHISNLEQVTHSANIKHAWDNGLIKRSQKGNQNIIDSCGIKVKCVQTGEVFESMSAAARHIGISKGNISKNTKGRSGYAGKCKNTGEKLTWEILS